MKLNESTKVEAWEDDAICKQSAYFNLNTVTSTRFS